jgi:DNA-binding LacI/PurR family transcriptional regulator
MQKMTILKDLALATGLSVSTVSAALRGAGPGLGLSESTIRKVQAASRKLHYIPLQRGRALVRGRQNVLLAVLPSDVRGAPWVAEHLWGASAGARKAGYGISVAVLDPNTQSFEDLGRDVLGGVDGVAFFYGRSRDPERCEAAGLPAVGLAREKAPNTVAMKTATGVQELWKRLRGQGVRELHLWALPGWRTRGGRAFVRDVLARSPVRVVESEIRGGIAPAIARLRSAGPGAALISLQDDWIWELALAEAGKRGASEGVLKPLPWPVISYESTAYSHRSLARLGVGRLDIQTRRMGELAMELLATRLHHQGRVVSGRVVQARVEWPMTAR